MMRRHYIKRLIMTLVITVGILVVGSYVYAQGAPQDLFGTAPIDQTLELGREDIRVIIGRIIRAVLGLLGVIALGLIIYAGVLYMTAGGNEDRVGTAKKIMINAVIGLVIILSALAIVQFVLNTLSGAINPQLEEGVGCNRLDECNQGEFGGACIDNHFVVKSITPSQPTTGMNNVVARAVFSQGVGNNADEVLAITRDNRAVNQEFAYRFADAANRKVVEVIATDQAQCVEQDKRAIDRCVTLSLENYHVSVNPNVVSAGGRALEQGEVCEGFIPVNEVDFHANEAKNDIIAPRVAAPTLRSQGGELFGGAVMRIPRNNVYFVESSIGDDRGVGYGKLQIRADDGDEIIRFDGPRKGQSAQPFAMSERIIIGNEVPINKEYVATVTGYDIDHNTAVAEARIVVVGEHCGNGVQDGNEIDVDQGGDCGFADGSNCENDAQCASGKCILNQCVAYPRIDDVDPMSGARGNFVTIVGRNFGEEQGRVVFRYDSNADGRITPADRGVEALLALCEETDQWKNGWVVVEVPDIPENQRAQIELTPRGIDFTDTTTDDFGPKPGGDGLFTINNEVRPGLCSVTVLENVLGDNGEVVIRAGATAAPPRTKVRARGKEFNSEQNQSTFQFGGTIAPVDAWVNAQIDGRVPGNLASGRVGVFVEVNGKRSNGVPFDVIASDDQKFRPVISLIDPAQITAGSYVTIFGNGFDGTGKIAITKLRNKVTACLDDANDPDCIQLNVTEFPEQCRRTWTNTQVIAQIPDDAAVGDYFVILQNGAGLATDGANTLMIVAGPASPSICQLDPAEGPAPLPPEAGPLNLYGANFSANPAVYFWTKNAAADNIQTWLGTRDIQLVNPNPRNAHLTVRIPVDQGSGQTMETGPIKIVANGRESNSVKYTVTDCRGAGAIPGLRCCESGSDAGRWRPEEFVCEGETREAGYVWRFTTGRIPILPYVVEGCDIARWGEQVPLPFPSPVPWIEWPQGKDACVNSLIGMRFSTDIDEASLNGKVKVYTCRNAEDGSIDCSQKQEVHDVLPQYLNRVLELHRPDARDLDANTWYHVEIIDGVLSAPAPGLLGEVVPGIPLLKTRPCDEVSADNTAYCFDFKTGGGRCTLIGAGVNPDSWVTKLLGVVQDPRFNPEFENVFNPPHPLYYFVWGRGSQACTVLDVDRFNWQWTPIPEQRDAKATTEKAPGPGFVNRRAKVTAHADSPEPVEIGAEAEGVRGIGNLIIDLGNPKVIEFWPSCAEACINAEFSAIFDQLMVKDDYPGHISIQRCTDSRCSQTIDAGVRLQVDMARSDKNTLFAYPEAGRYLAPSTWYQVELQGIRAIGAIREGVEIAGNAIEPFIWKFRTKADASPCLVSTVNVEPDPFTAQVIGEKTRYVSHAKGAPDECNPKGQRLNPWDYGWGWSVADPEVARVTQFATQGRLKPYCTLGCTSVGADVARGETQSICGNNIVEAGEDCDIARAGEVVGVGCTLACLRPGSEAATCGNGVVENNLGEECDEGGDKAAWRFCSQKCTNKGSSKEFNPNDERASWCGSGDVTLGEDCDINDPATRARCSDECTHEGTELAQQWCDRNDPRRAECRDAVSVCGNGVVESGETCERGVNGVLENECNNRCLFADICGSPRAQCEAGTEGCTGLCTLAGSSVLYDTPSLCGDGVVGIGESPECELAGADINPAQVLGHNPVQLVTAVGEKEDLNPETQTQDTTINATALTFKNLQELRQPLQPQVVGQGEYHLQCGFTESRDPQVINDELTRFNDCPNAHDGVAKNSCCYARPMRTLEYPRDGAGIDRGVGAAICRNTLISVRFNQRIEERTLRDNIILARGVGRDGNCEPGEAEVTDIVHAQLDVRRVLADSRNPLEFIAELWNRAKAFFASIFGEKVEATRFVPRPFWQKWCQENIPFETELTDGVDPQANNQEFSEVSLYLDDILAGDAVYAVYMKGGLSGIKDVRGVGIGSRDVATARDDMWLFRTMDEICRLNGVRVEPVKHVFTALNTVKEFTAFADSTNGQLIISTPAYEWDWSWGPANHPVFRIPVENTPGNEPQIQIGSRDLEGGAVSVAQARVTRDTSGEEDNHERRVFSGLFELNALFCERPWPVVGEYPFRDNEYHFSMAYCASKGRAGIEEDDLPYLNYPGFSTTEAAQLADEDLRKKYLFFTLDNEDVIGVQIFRNPDSLTVQSWYIRKFGELGIMKSTTVAGQTALTDDTNYYVVALNVADDGRIFSNIYQFSVNRDAADGTREVLTELLDSLEFNFHVTDYGYCIAAGVDPNAGMRNVELNDQLRCSSDFDCLTDLGAPKEGTNGVCSAERTKLLRDWLRLHDIQQIQQSLERRRPYPQFAAGSFLPGITLSKWQTSWNELGRLVGLGGIPKDPLNRWTACPDHDPETCWSVPNATFACPAKSSIYAYEIMQGQQGYRLHAPLEYFRVNDPMVANFVDIQKFTAAPWCEGIIINPQAGVCGDGRVNPGEGCDPQGRQKNEQCALQNGGAGIQVFECSAQCQWQAVGNCQVFAQCGNGRVEGAEVCDDGALNGVYGHCGTDCRGQFAQYCGNNQLDRNAQGRPLEYCDEVDGACLFMTDEGQVIKPQAFIMLDRSGSTGGRRWNAARQALDSIADQYTTHNDAQGNQVPARADFALSVFPAQGQNCGDPEVLLPMGSYDQAQFKNSYRNVLAGGQTPTDRAMVYLLNNVGSIFSNDARRPRFVVLVTDGQPGCRSGDGQARLAATIGATQRLKRQDILTYVVGFSNLNQQFLDNLNQIASAGGTDNPNDPQNRYFTAQNAQQLVDVFRNILSCGTYNRYQSGSCAWDCQGPGSYCGDTVIQQNNEACDDGNNVDNDQCTNACEINQSPFVAPPPPAPGAEPASCGDGVAQNPNSQGVAEACDLGAQNGVACLPQYGRSCTYCSFDCRNILTVDPVAFCGNGIVDYEDIDHDGRRDADEPRTEDCDVKADGTVVSYSEQFSFVFAGGREERNLSFSNSLDQICEEKGAFQCANNCRQLVDNCVACTQIESGPIPRLAFVNPMIRAGTAAWPFGQLDDAELIRGDETFGALQYRYERNQPVEQHPTTLRNIPMSQSYGLETSPLCDGQYGLIFNYGNITQGGQSRTAFIQSGGGDLFAYPVNGEGATVDHDVIISPAVRPAEFRVVIKWTKAEADQNAEFGGVVYSDRFSEAVNPENPALNPPLVSYALASLPGPNRSTNLCTTMELRDDAWVPTNEPNDQDNTCRHYHDNVSVHPITSTVSSSTVVQSFTIHTAFNNGEPFAFMVQGLSGYIGRNQYKNSNLEVEVYAYHAGQNNSYSIYKPVRTFSIRGAEGTSSNVRAQYWHVFNLVRDANRAYIIEAPKETRFEGGQQPTVIEYQNGSIETDICEVRRNIPGAELCVEAQP